MAHKWLHHSSCPASGNLALSWAGPQRRLTRYPREWCLKDTELRKIFTDKMGTTWMWLTEDWALELLKRTHIWAWMAGDRSREDGKVTLPQNQWAYLTFRISDGSQKTPATKSPDCKRRRHCDLINMTRTDHWGWSIRTNKRESVHWSIGFWFLIPYFTKPQTGPLPCLKASLKICVTTANVLYSEESILQGVQSVIFFAAWRVALTWPGTVEHA